MAPCWHPIHSPALQLGQTDGHGMPRADGPEEQQGAAEDPREEGPVLQSCGTVGTRVARRRAKQSREQAERKMLRAQPHMLRRGPFCPQAALWGRQCHGWPPAPAAPCSSRGDPSGLTSTPRAGGDAGAGAGEEELRANNSNRNRVEPFQLFICQMDSFPALFFFFL